MPIKVFLTVTAGPSKGTERDFAKGTLVMGRGKVDLILFDKKVSSQHSRFEIEGDNCWIEDLNSTNGTIVGGQRIQGRVKLQNLDEIVVGHSKISVAIVDQISEFKKSKIAKVKAPKTPPPEAVSQISKTLSKSEVTANPEPQYRETGMRRIEDLIKDEMNTFSKWDHPTVGGEKESKSGAVPRVRVHLFLKKGEGVSNFTCTKPVSTIGRKGVDIKLNDLDCSRLHAQIEIVGGNIALLKDLASTNGTFVNGKRISNHELKTGDALQIGQTIFEVEVEGADD